MDMNMQRFQKMEEQKEELSRRLLTTEEELSLDITMEENGMHDIETPPGCESPGLSPEPGMLRICPLCNARIRLYFVNLNEKVLMCENDQCEWPFGYEELTFVKEDHECDSGEEVESIQSSTRGSASESGSFSTGGSTIINFEIDQMQAALYSDTESICTTSSFDSNFEIQPRKVPKVQENEKINENLNKMETMTIELQDETKNVAKSIKDLKTLRKLKKLEEMSGKSLLKPGEVQRLKNENPNIGLGELKIDINPGNEDSVSSIRIEILDQSNDGPSDGPKSPGKVAL